MRYCGHNIRCLASRLMLQANINLQYYTHVKLRTDLNCYRIGPPVDDMQRLRVEKMERQLANLTGLVQKALQVPGAAVATTAPAAAPRQEYQTYASRPATQGKNMETFIS